MILNTNRCLLKVAADHHAGWREFLTRLPASGLIAPDNPLLTG